MEVSLQIIDGRLKGETGVRKFGAFTIRQPRFLIGRDSNCNMVCKSRLVSARHCMIAISEDKVTLEDLNSGNGTFVNGIRVQGKKLLTTGDILAVGRLKFIVSVETHRVARATAIDRQETDAATPRDTVALSAATSDTVVDRPGSDPDDRTDGIDDLVSDLLLEADEKERELRKSDPAARYLRIETATDLLNEPEASVAETVESESPKPTAKNGRHERPTRKRPIKLPADKLPQPPSITGVDSVDAAELALEELFRSPKKHR